MRRPYTWSAHLESSPPVYSQQMATRPRRRFPLLALLGVVVLVVASVYAMVTFNLLPRRSETWIEIPSARVEIRHYVCGIRWKSSVPSEWNHLAERMAAANGTESARPQWHRCDSTSSWLGTHDHAVADFELRTSVGLANQWLDGTSQALRVGESGISLDQGAQDKLGSALLKMFDRGVDTDFVYLYMRTSENRFYELGRTIRASDVVRADSWLDDPTPLHYFGPDRIH